MKASDMKPDGRFFGLFVGRSKSGKTGAAVSFPPPVLLLDGDMRAEGILGCQAWLKDLDKVEVKRFPPNLGFTELEKEIELLSLSIQARQSPYKTLILDSITTINRMFLTDAHELLKGETKGKVRLTGPSDYKYEAEACYQIFDYLRSIPMNIIVSAHIIDVYGKLDPDKEYSDYGKIGERLSIRDKIGENIQIFFNEVYRFSKAETVTNTVKHYVQFRSELAGTCHAELPNGKVDITGKNFYDVWQSFLKGERDVQGKN